MKYSTLFLKFVAGFAIACVFCISIVTLIGMAGQSDCVARAVNGGTCPADSFSFINFHLSAYARLAQVILFLFFILFALFLFSSRHLQKSFSALSRCVLYVPVSYFSFLRWTALHEMSPTSQF